MNIFLCPHTMARTNAGYTLVELLVVIIILGLLASLGVELLHLGGRSWNKSNYMATTIATIESTQLLLRNELTRIQPFETRSDDITTVAFVGEPTALEFYAPLPTAYAWYGPVYIRLSIDKTAKDEKTLFIAWQSDPASSWKRSALISSIKEIRFDYYGPTYDNSPPSWQSTWIRKKTLPQAIKLHIDFSAEKNFAWPEFVVAPAIEATADSIDGLR